MIVGSLFTGYDGIGMGLEMAGVPVERAWFSDNEIGPSKLLYSHWADVPNLGDITRIKWKKIQKVDLLTGGFPCQDLSLAGRQAGLHGKQSGLWKHMFKAIKTLRPPLVLAENVRGLLSGKADSEVEPCAGCVGDAATFNVRALGAVLADLAGIGYDARWVSLPASGVGAPHQRIRVVVLAWDTLAHPDDRAGHWQRPRSKSRQGGKVGGRRQPAAADAGVLKKRRLRERAAAKIPTARVYRPSVAHPDDQQRQWEHRELQGRAAFAGDSAENAADSQGERRHEGQSEPAGRRGADAPQHSCAPASDAGGIGLDSGVTGRDGEGAPVRRKKKRASKRRDRKAAAHPDGARRKGHRAERAEPEVDDLAGDRVAAADAAGVGRDRGKGLKGLGRKKAKRGKEIRDSLVGGPSQPVADASGARRGRVAGEPPAEEARPHEGDQSPDLGRGGPHTDWGPYSYAVERWQGETERQAPPPTGLSVRGGQTLSPSFVEWMMGLPAGHVVGVPGLTRAQQLKLLGNGVVPQQIAAAWLHLTDWEGVS